MASNLKTLGPVVISQSGIPAIAITPERKQRILLIITRLTVGGDTNVVLDIADHFQNHPMFEACLAVGPVPESEIDLTHLAYDRKIPTTVIPNLINHIRPWQNLKALLDLRDLIVKEKIDIVHTHSSVAGIIGRLAAFTAGVPVIVHHIHGWGLQEDMSAFMKSIYLNLERFCALFTRRLIAVSQKTIEKGLSYKICPERKFSLIYNGIDLDKFRQPVNHQEVRQSLGLKAGTKIVGMIGRLDKQKNPLDLIRAAGIVKKEYPNVQFIVAGDGSLRPECEALIKNLNLQETFHLLGFRSDIQKILPIMNLVVSTSLWEGLPVVFQEAMSAGKPIVANDVDGVCDVVINGQTGYLVTPHQTGEMAERIVELLRDEAVCHEMGMNAEQASECFSTGQMLAEIELLYKELSIKQAGKPGLLQSQVPS